MPIIDYDLAVLIQPMLMFGVSIGVAFNVIFADWMVTVLLISLFIGTSSKAFCRGIETWNKETIMKQEAAKQLEPNGDRAQTGYKLLPGSPSNINDTKAEKSLKEDVTVMEAGRNLVFLPLDLYVYVLRVVGGLLGLGGGFIMGPLFLELGIPPQVSSATATFTMMFSASLSVVEYCLLKRFPVPYALYFLMVATIADFVGQHVVRRLIIIMGRASLIIFIIAFTIFVSAISLRTNQASKLLRDAADRSGWAICYYTEAGGFREDSPETFANRKMEAVQITARIWMPRVMQIYFSRRNFGFWNVLTITVLGG